MIIRSFSVLFFTALLVLLTTSTYATHVPPGVCKSPEVVKAEIKAEPPSEEAQFATMDGELAAYIVRRYNELPPRTNVPGTSVLVVTGPLMRVMTPQGYEPYVILVAFADGCMSFHAMIPVEMFQEWLRTMPAA